MVSSHLLLGEIPHSGHINPYPQVRDFRPPWQPMESPAVTLQPLEVGIETPPPCHGSERSASFLWGSVGWKTKRQRCNAVEDFHKQKMKLGGNTP